MTNPPDKPNPAAPLSPLKQAFLAMQAAQARVDELELERSEPIAIIGIGCRIPAAGEGVDGYWKLLTEGRVAVSDGVEKRFADLQRPTRLPESAHWAALLDQIDGFDPQHFGISPREAVGIDPQQRLLLETSWQALEDAGLDPFSLLKSRTGVFVGICSDDYAQLQLQDPGRDKLDPHFASGIASSVASGRIAYVLGLRGPAVSVDTACSSSLVAVHLACAAIRNGDCSMALAGGVNLILSPEFSIAFAEAGMLSPHGLCRTFDQEADGFVRGEGCGIIVLKRLSEAEADGDRILAVVRGSAVNQDGATSGLTVPNGQAQQELLRQAHRNAGVEARQIGYVETHGTGTTLGDPIEAEALGAVFGSSRRERPLLLGAVKANLGHLEAAAGITGLIKVILTLQHGVIPRHPTLDRLNPLVRWDQLPLEVVKDARPWPVIDGRRIAGVSSFGFSGTNAHVVLEGVEPAPPSQDETPIDRALVISARTATALLQLAARYAEFLEQSEAAWEDICYTAATGRAVFSERLAIVAQSKTEAAGNLRKGLKDGSLSAGVFQGRVGAQELGRQDQTPRKGGDAYAVAEAFVRGTRVGGETQEAGRRHNRVPLPGYVFQRESYWFKPKPKAARNAPSSMAEGRMLGSRISVAGVRALFESRLKVSGANGWIGEHVMDGRPVLPLTGHLELMLEASAKILGPRMFLEDLVLLAPLVVNPESTVQLVIENPVQGRSRMRVFARTGKDNEDLWQSASEIQALAAPAGTDPNGSGKLVDLDAVKARLVEHDNIAAFYADMAHCGANFGPTFRGVVRMWHGPDEALGEIKATAEEQGYIFAPWRLDACLQLIGAVRGDEDLYLPSSVAKIAIYGAPGPTCWSHLLSRRIDAATLSVDVTIVDPDGSILAAFTGILFRKVAVPKKDWTTWFYRLTWRRTKGLLPPPPPSSSAGLARNHRVALIAGDSKAQKVAARMRELGAAVQVMTPGEASEGMSRLSGFDAVVCFASNEARELHPGGVVTQAEESIRSTLGVAQALLAGSANKPRLYLLTRNVCVVDEAAHSPHILDSPFIGMAAALALEAPELRCTLIDGALGEDDLIAGQIADEVLAGADDLRIAFRSGLRHIAAIERVQATELPGDKPEPKKLVLGTGIEGLTYSPLELPELQPDEVEISVRATALNFRDVLKATGLLDHAGPVGTDCSGVVARVGSQVSRFQPGDPIIAIAPGCFATSVVTAAALVIHKPVQLSFEESAAQTVAYLTADYCLNHLARVQKGERVLIHSAAGGVGLAAVYLCRRAGAEIFATAGSETKRAWLRGLGIERVFDSRTLAFKDQIDGGVDVVLNSLSGKAIDAGLALLRPNGRFMELGKTDLRSPGEIERNWPAVTYIAADLTPLFAARSPWVGERMTALLGEIAANELPALPLTIFDENDIKQAFRYMAAARHVGRIVIRSSARDYATGTHLVTGGLQGIGARLAEWLVDRGARDLVLVGRSRMSEESARMVAQLEARGARVRTFQGDIGDIEVARRLLRDIGSSLRGVWHCAGVIDDAILSEQSWNRFAGVMHPKVDGAWNLHLLTKELRLEFFVMFSSWASLAGSRGQANYCAANAFLDCLAAVRHAEGLPALAVNWGAWGETGLASGENLQRHLARSGMRIMPPADALAALDSALRITDTQMAIAAVDWPKYLGQIPDAQRGFYVELIRESAAAGSVGGSIQNQSPKSDSYSSTSAQEEHHTELSRIMEASEAGRRAEIQRVIEDVVRRTLDLRSSDQLGPDKLLSDLGMDSLLGIDMRNSLSTTLDRRLPSTFVFDYPTLQKMVRFVERDIFPALPPEQIIHQEKLFGGDTVNGFAAPGILDDIEQLSDDEVDSMFEKKVHQ